jgi:transposase
MKQWTEIRGKVLRDGVSKRAILRETGMHWRTLEKVLQYSEPPGYRIKEERDKPKLGAFLRRIEEILESDKELPKKQRHTAKRIYERLKEESYEGKYTVVREAVRQISRLSQEVFMPLVHRPGEAQADFGYALARISGELRKLAFFVMVLPYSDAFFVMAFERECTESYWEGHIRAFDFLGGVPRRISYDNSTVMVSKIIGSHQRQLTYGFLQLQSHYLFESHFCRVNRPNEKGVAEGVVKYTRLNFFVPVPEARDLEELNGRLWERCREDLKRRVRGKGGVKSELLAEDQAAFLPFPAAPFDACRKQSTAASSLSLVRFDNNDYSVPVRYAHHPIVVKGYVDRVEFYHKGERVAVHRRSWSKEGVFFNYQHYLALLEKKPGSLDHALPLADLDLPECFDILRRRLELNHEQEGEGIREYIRVLRLLEDHSVAKLRQAVEKALRIGALSRDAISLFLVREQPWQHTTFRLEGREHLCYVTVAQPDISVYRVLLSEGGGV